jgi:arginine/lysine/ornithine decarboxylase
MDHLYEKLVGYSKADYYPMHMPGHKRNTDIMTMVNPYAIDITEIDGFDNLHDANEILLDCMKRAATLYRSKNTHFLVNGSTVGILTAIAACTNRGDWILVARNCHKAVYHAIFLNELYPIYLYPEVEEELGISKGITVSQVKEQLDRYPDIKAVVITSPTYEGIVSDIDSISKLVHEYGVPLIVDEAHGAHFGFHEAFPKSSVARGADIVIHSVHKTLPAFTQTALIHINGNIVDYSKVQMYLSIYQSSSPSYLLMAGIDRCVTLLEKESKELFDAFYIRLQEFYKRMSHLQEIKVYKPLPKRCAGDKSDMYMKMESINIDNQLIQDHAIYDFDISKIVISTKRTSINGMQLYETLLDKYKIQLEMVSKDYALAMTSICDSNVGFERLANALEEIDASLLIRKRDIVTSTRPQEESSGLTPMKMSLVLTPYQAYNLEMEQVDLKGSTGRIAGDYIYLYPPGIPLVVPGERIGKDLIDRIQEYMENGLSVKGLIGTEMIRVLLGEHLNG